MKLGFLTAGLPQRSLASHQQPSAHRNNRFR
jgi:hypothetical protein